MQQQRKLAIAAITVTALIVLVAVFGRQQRAEVAGTTGGSAWLPELKPALAAVTKLHIKSATSVSTLVRGEKGWGVEERAGYPVDFTRLGSLLNDLAEAHRVEQKTAKAEFFARLGLDDVDKPDSKAVLVEIWNGNDAPAWRLLIGNAAEGPGGRFVRLADSTETWLIDRSPQALAEPTDWLEHKLLGIDFERVAKVQRTQPANAVFAASRAAATDPNLAGEAIPAGKKPKYEAVFDAVARAVLGAELEDVKRADTAGFDGATPAQSKIACFDGLQLEIDALKAADGNWIRARALVGEPIAAPAAAVKPDVTAAAPDASTKTAATEAAAPAAETPAAAEEDAKRLATEVATLNARLDGWAFKVSDYVYNELSKGLPEYLDDLDPAPAAPGKPAAAAAAADEHDG